MTPDQFERLALRILGTSVDWQDRIGRQLDVTPRTVRRWLASRNIPPWVEAKLASLIGAGDVAAPWPRDEWIVGDAVTEDGRAREYLVHLESPRFACRIVALDDDGEPLETEQPVDTTGLVFQADPETWLAEVAWIDPEPALHEVGALMEAAAEALDRLNEREGLDQ